MLLRLKGNFLYLNGFTDVFIVLCFYTNVKFKNIRNIFTEMHVVVFYSTNGFTWNGTRTMR